MTSEIFESWVREFDQNMSRKGRKVVLIVDNCPAHPDIKGLKAVELVFSPPNTTSKTQPMDQGVIQSLKCQYRKRVLYSAIRAIDSGRMLSINVYEALEMLQQAWTSVSAVTIRNCFRKAGFAVVDDENVTTDDQSDEDPEDDIPLARLRSLGLNQVSARDFLTLDDDLPTSMETTDDAIIEDVLSRKRPTQDDDEEEETVETVETPVYSVDQLLDACVVLRNHFRSKDNASEFLKCLCKMSDTVMRDDMQKCTRQTEITSFFK